MDSFNIYNNLKSQIPFPRRKFDLPKVAQFGSSRARNEALDYVTSHLITPDHHALPQQRNPDAIWILRPSPTGLLPVASHAPCVSVPMPLLMLLFPLENCFPLSFFFLIIIIIINYNLPLMLSLRLILSWTFSRIILAMGTDLPFLGTLFTVSLIKHLLCKISIYNS